MIGDVSSDQHLPEPTGRGQSASILDLYPPRSPGPAAYPPPSSPRRLPTALTPSQIPPLRPSVTPSQPIPSKVTMASTLPPTRTTAASPTPPLPRTRRLRPSSRAARSPPCWIRSWARRSGLSERRPETRRRRASALPSCSSGPCPRFRCPRRSADSLFVCGFPVDSATGEIRKAEGKAAAKGGAMYSA